MATNLTKLEDDSDAAHKRRLIAEGEFFRVGILHAKANVGNAIRPESLLRGVAEHAQLFASTRMDHFMAAPVAGVRSVMPYVLTVASFINRKKLVKPALAVCVVLAGVTAWLVRRNRTPEEVR